MTDASNTVKTVNRLKKKHRDRLWMDCEGDIWFFNHDTDQWNVLMRGINNDWHVSTKFSPIYYPKFTQLTGAAQP